MNCPSLGALPNMRLLLPGAPVLKECGIVRLAAQAVRLRGRLACGRGARSRNAIR
jgi:hypothetical protein